MREKRTHRFSMSSRDPSCSGSVPRSFVEDISLHQPHDPIRSPPTSNLHIILAAPFPTTGHYIRCLRKVCCFAAIHYGRIRPFVPHATRIRFVPTSTHSSAHVSVRERSRPPCHRIGDALAASQIRELLETTDCTAQGSIERIVRQLPAKHTPPRLIARIPVLAGSRQ